MADELFEKSLIPGLSDTEYTQLMREVRLAWKVITENEGKPPGDIRAIHRAARILEGLESG